MMEDTVEQSSGSRKAGHAALRCSTCGVEWVPYAAGQESDSLLQFDAVRVLNTLIELQHKNHSRPNASAAAADAYRFILDHREHFAPASISLREWLTACGELSKSFAETGFVAAATARASLLYEQVVRGASGEEFKRVERAANLARNLEKEIRMLQNKGGRPSKRVLGLAELTLSRGGFSVDEIAELDLDGGGYVSNGDGGDHARDRVKKRLLKTEEGDAELWLCEEE